MRANIIMFVAGLMLAGSLASCSEGAAEPPRQQSATLEVAAAVPVDSQSAGVRIEVYRCGAKQPELTRRLGFTAASLDELTAFAHKPVELAKEHFFARTSWQLRAGCYYATAQPLDLHRKPQARCSPTQTARVPLGPGARRHFLLVARCGDAPSDLPMVDNQLNFAPAVTELTTRASSSPGQTEVCAKARDAEADKLQMRWDARDEAGRLVKLTNPHHSRQIGSTLTECVTVPASESAVEVEATAVDGVDHPSGGFVSYEELRLHRYGIAAQSRSTETVRVEASLPDHCLASTSAGIAEWTYWIRRDGRILSPTRDLAALKPGDTVEVEVDVDDECRDVRVALVAGRADQMVARDAGKFEPGSHVLWIEVPDDGPFVVALMAETAGRTRVLDRFEFASHRGEG